MMNLLGQLTVPYLAHLIAFLCVAFKEIQEGLDLISLLIMHSKKQKDIKIVWTSSNEK